MLPAAKLAKWEAENTELLLLLLLMLLAWSLPSKHFTCAPYRGPIEGNKYLTNKQNVQECTETIREKRR